MNKKSGKIKMRNKKIGKSFTAKEINVQLKLKGGPEKMSPVKYTFLNIVLIVVRLHWFFIGSVHIYYLYLAWLLVSSYIIFD